MACDEEMHILTVLKIISRYQIQEPQSTGEDYEDDEQF